MRKYVKESEIGLRRMKERNHDMNESVKKKIEQNDKTNQNKKKKKLARKIN